MNRKFFKLETQFSNVYSLAYADKPEHLTTISKYYPNAKRITYKEAVQLIKEEKNRRLLDPDFSGYSSIYIAPVDLLEVAELHYKTNFYRHYGLTVERHILRR